MKSINNVLEMEKMADYPAELLGECESHSNGMVLGEMFKATKSKNNFYMCLKCKHVPTYVPIRSYSFR